MLVAQREALKANALCVSIDTPRQMARSNDEGTRIPTLEVLMNLNKRYESSIVTDDGRLSCMYQTVNAPS